MLAFKSSPLNCYGTMLFHRHSVALFRSALTSSLSPSQRADIMVNWVVPSQWTDVFNTCGSVWRPSSWTDDKCLIIWMDGGGLGAVDVWWARWLAHNGLCSAVECVSATESSESQGLVSETDLWGYTIRIQDCIFSLQRSQRSSSDRRLLTVIGCYLGGCQLKRQLSTFYAS